MALRGLIQQLGRSLGIAQIERDQRPKRQAARFFRPLAQARIEPHRFGDRLIGAHVLAPRQLHLGDLAQQLGLQLRLRAHRLHHLRAALVEQQAGRRPDALRVVRVGVAEHVEQELRRRGRARCLLARLQAERHGDQRDADQRHAARRRSRHRADDVRRTS